MESDDSMSVLLPMVSLMLLLVFAGGLWFLRTRNQLRGASQSFLARMLLQEQETITRLDLERGEAQAERWKCSVCEFSNALDRPTCMLCGTKNTKHHRRGSDREELPRLKHSIAGRDERLSSTSSITMLTRPSLSTQRSSVLSVGSRQSLRPLRLSTLNPRQKYARRRKEWVRCLGEDGESAFWTRADVAAAARRLTVVNGAANHGGHGRVSVGFVTHMVRRSSTMGDVGRLTFAEASQLDAAETISGYKLTARELELLDRVSRLPFPKKYSWFLERMGALLRPWEEGRIKLRVQREHILVESMEQLLGIQPEHIHFPLRIEFVGEAGIDAGGLQREWFSILFGRLLDDELGLFMTCNRHTQAVAINPHSEDCTADHLLYFRGIGRLLGRALLEGQTMQARLCLPILKHFLGTPITFSDLQYVDPEVYTSMLWIRDNDGVDALELTFCVTELRADDEVITIDLVPDGRDKPVTDANKLEFLHLKLRYLMLDRYAPQLQALSLGLFEIIPQEALLVFDYQELELVLCGLPEIDMVDWKRNTVVAPSFSDTPIVVDWFWEVIQGFTEDERARFLQFSTGSSRVPVQGFKGLTSYDGRICPFSLRPLPNQTRGFPKVHTCFNRVELPLYATKAEMESALYAVLDMEWTEFSEDGHFCVSSLEESKVLLSVGKKPHTQLLREIVQGLADTVWKLMNGTAVSGLGADSSSPMTFPFPNSAGYYRSDEEEEYEVDNSFDYIPVDESSGGEPPNKLMASVLTIEQQTSLTVIVGGNISSDRGCDETSDDLEEEKEPVLDEEDEHQQVTDVLPTAAEKNDTIPARLEPTTAIVPLRDDPVDEVGAELDVSNGEEIVSETPESGEAQDERTEEAVQPPEELTQIPSTQSKSQDASPSDLSPAVVPGVNDGVASVARTCGSSVSEQGLQDEKKDEELTAATTDNSPKPSRMKTPAAPVHTPKKPKRTTSKKRKTPPTLKSDNNQRVKARCSSRVKYESPKSVKPLVDRVMSQFNRLPINISCNYCGKEIKDSPGNATRHLKSFPALRTQQLTAAQKVEVVPEAVELPVAAPPRVTTDSGMTLAQLMGTKALAAKVQGAFASTPFAGDAPIGRFDDIVNKGLRHLVVVNLLDAVDPLDGPILQLQTTVPGNDCRTGFDQLAPLSKAKARALGGNPLRFPAPRTVAEQFISPLAKELGLEYAMHQHTAKVVSCPRDGVGLDWRFRQTETVVFQLREKATWKLKKGKVELPLESFESKTWLMEEMAQLAKAHGLAAGRTATDGFLLPPRVHPPREDLHIFDEEGNGKNELLGHLLQPGSVAYVPAGVWFQVTTKGESALWIEVELSSMSYARLMLSAMKQLSHGDKQARKRLQIHRGNRDQAKSVRHHLEACIQALRNEITELKGADLVPEYLCTDDLPDLISRGLIRDVSTSPGFLSIEVDLTDSRLKLKHEKVFKDAVYRVNPVALLLREDFIPHITVDKEKRDAGSDRPSPPQKTHRALKKTRKPPPKRTQALATTSSGRQVYNLDVMFGSQDFQSQLHVRCQCSPEQSSLMEWIRSRGNKSFGLEELTRSSDLMLQGKSSRRTEETARNVLRFLCSVGYVTLMHVL